MSTDFSAALPYLPELLRALLNGVYITVVGFTAGALLGVPLALAKSGTSKVLGWASRVFIETFRNTPLLVQLYLIYFGLGQIGLNFNPLWSAFLGLTLNNAAYSAEIFRAGFESVPVGLKEASSVLGLGSFQTFRYVLFKPALRNVLPSLTNQLIILFLFSSVASIISFHELTDELRQLVSQTSLTLELFTFGAALYYLVSALAAVASRVAERTLFRW